MYLQVVLSGRHTTGNSVGSITTASWRLPQITTSREDLALVVCPGRCDNSLGQWKGGGGGGGAQYGNESLYKHLCMTRFPTHSTTLYYRPCIS